MTEEQWVALRNYIDARITELLGVQKGFGGGTLERRLCEEEVMRTIFGPENA